MKWLRRRRAGRARLAAKRKGLRPQAASRTGAPRQVDSRKARAWRRRFRRLMRLDTGNRRTDGRSTRGKQSERRLGSLLRLAVTTVGRALTYVLVAALFAGLPFGTLLGYRWLVSSPHFLLRQVKVSGNGTLDSDAIVAAAGLDGPVSTLTLDEEELAAAVTALDAVKSARVTVELPQTVTLEVVERTPTAVVALGRLYLVDEHAALYRPLEPGETSTLPILTGFRRADFTDPGRQGESRRRIQAALGVARAWTSTGLGAVAPLSEIECDPIYGQIVRTAEHGVEVWLGRGGDVRPKLERLADVLLDLRLRGRVARVVYLDGPNALGRVVVRSEEVRAAAIVEQVARSDQGL